VFKELVAEAKRLRVQAGRGLPPVAYKPKTPKWVIELTEEGFSLQGPYTRKDTLRPISAPDRQRSGKPSEANCKPFLLMDKALYSLGIAKEGKGQEASLLHQGFKQILLEAHQSTQEPSLKRILEFLEQPIPNEMLVKIEPDDLVAVRTGSNQFPFELPEIQRFWADYLGQELVTTDKARCLSCGLEKPVVRILTRELVIMGQKCQVTSFNQESFTSFGLAQTTNSPLCFTCANDVIDGLDYLTRSKRNASVLTRDESKSASKSPLKNQLAVFWLSQDLPPEQVGETVIEDPLELLAAAVEDVLPGKPPVMLSQLKDALTYPHMLKARGLNTLVDEAKFHLLVLSANKGRMVVREWLSESVRDVFERLDTYAEATSLVGPWGEPARPFTVRQLLRALDTTDTNLLRPLLRTAYSGHFPPQTLLTVAVQRLRTLWVGGKEDEYFREQQRLWNIHAALAAIKLVLTYGKERATTMKELDEAEGSVPYLCGRMLAVLEEAQRRASGQDINATIIDRFYSSVAAAPGTHLVRLHNQAMRAHLPRLRRQGRGYGTLSTQLGHLMQAIGQKGGLPGTLSVQQQGEFGIGYWSQRVIYRKRKEASNEDDDKGGSR
jgi:CRISPR-associated protein Csd1